MDLATVKFKVVQSSSKLNLGNYLVGKIVRT